MPGPIGCGEFEFMLRLLLPSDAAQYRALRLNNLLLYPAYFRADAGEESVKPLSTSERRLRPSATNRWQGAFDRRGFLVGAVGLRREPGSKRGHVAQVLGLSVSPEWQHKGVATALMQDVIGYAQRLEGVRQLQLSVTLPNPAAERLYERLGFRVFGTEADALRVGGVSWHKQHRQLILAS
jgi:ribosomal protein S18 acetylase RimI-like enzyme